MISCGLGAVIEWRVTNNSLTPLKVCHSPLAVSSLPFTDKFDRLSPSNFLLYSAIIKCSKNFVIISFSNALDGRSK